MRSKYTILGIAAMAMAVVPAAAFAQDSTDTQRRDAALVLDHTFNSTMGEPVRVFLAKGITYRAEVEGTSIQLQLKTLLSSVQQPYIAPMLDNASASGSTLYTIKPHADAVYIFTTTGGDAALPVRLRVVALPNKSDKKP